ncbi:MAG: MFS transporter [Novosphingobium sp.]
MPRSLLLGVSEAGILTVVNTLIGDYWDDKGRRNWLFLQGILGPFIAGIVALIVGYATKVQWNGVFFVYLVALPIWAAMFVWIFESKKHDPAAAAEAGHSPVKQAAKSPFPWAAALTIALVTFFVPMLYYVFIINGSLAFAEVGVTDSRAYAGMIFVLQLFILLGAAFFRLLANRPYALQLGVVLFLLGSGLAGMGLATTPMAMAIALVAQQTAAGMTVPTLIGWAQTKFDFAHRGRGMGIWTAAFFLAQSQSPRMVHALVLHSGSMQGAFLAAGLAGLAGLAAAVLAFGILALGKMA